MRSSRSSSASLSPAHDARRRATAHAALRALASRHAFGAPACDDPAAAWDPQSTSLAWPGAAPVLGVTAARAPRVWSPDGPLFDPRGFRVTTLSGQGKNTILDAFLARWHYSGSRGMNGPAFAMYDDRAGTPALVAVCTFGRIANPAWAEHAFPCDSAEFGLVASGLVTAQALRHTLVGESEYLELNRLAAVDGLGHNAVTWFVGHVVDWLVARNRMLYRAQRMRERGFALDSLQAALLDAARLDSWQHGWGMTKALVSFADPWQGHVGTVYQALAWHYAGRSTDDGRWETGYVGLRSGDRISKRTLQKARAPHEAGHGTAALRLAWEGADVVLEAVTGDRVVAEVPLPSMHHHGLVAGGAMDRLLADQWRQLESAARAQHGCDRLRARVLSAGTREERFPPKHRYLLPLGTPFWSHVIAWRSRHLRARVEAADHAWSAAHWGPRPDDRARFYPVSVPESERQPRLRHTHACLDLPLFRGAA